MIYYYTFVYYAIFASIVLVYGVGFNKIAEIGTVKFKEPIFYIKCAISIISSVVISWLLIHYLLVPLGITELFPFVENNFMENDLTGNNKNFNFIGNKKNNLIKMERLFNNKLNELAEYIDTKCFKKFQTPDILMEFEL